MTKALWGSRAAAFGGLFLLLSLTDAGAYSSAGWKHAKTEHFNLSYTDTTEQWLQQAARIAEGTRESLVRYFKDEGDLRTISIVLSDESDEPNGFSLQADPVVTIDCRKTQSLFRGEGDWLRTVLTHELSHQYSLQLLKSPFQIRSVLGLSSSSENFSLSYERTSSIITLPQWFVEGMAQMGSRLVGADSHDSMRRMVLGDAYRNGHLLTLEEMERFEGTSLDQELVYNQGFAFLIYLENTYSEATLADLCAAISKNGFLAAFPSTLGKTLRELYDEWKASLAQEYPEKSSAEGARLFHKKGPMVIETASDAGSFVIANWDNDFTRFSLFRQSRDGYSALANDTGPTLRIDALGGAWFTKLAYDATAGVSTYELFHVHRNGNISMETRGSRVAAFDVKDGHLAYARYGKSGTEIVVRKPNGSESVLGVAPWGTGVYSLVLLNPGSALVSLGTGDRVRLAIVDGSWRLLWPEQEVMDVIATGGDRVVFSSTLDGSPQLYWADLVRDPKRWYRLTNAAGGARFPAWDAKAATLTYSEYTDGSWRRCVAERELSDKLAVSIPGPLFGAVTLKPEAGTLAGPALFNPVVHVEPITFGWLGQRASDGITVSTAEAVLLGWQAAFYSAPGDWQLVGSVSALQNLNIGTAPTTDVQLGGLFAWGPTRNSLWYDLLSESTPGAYSTLETRTHTSSLSSQFQIDSRQTLGADVSVQVAEDVTPPMPESFVYLVLGGGGVRWSWSDTPTSVFDPAGLGQSGFGAFAEVRVLMPYSLSSRYWDGNIVRLDPMPAEQISGGWGFQSLLADSRLAAGGAVKAFATVGAAVDGRVLPWALESLGGEDSFSGYPAGYANIVRMVSAAVSMKTNPLVDKSNRTQWYERLSVGAQIEAGVGLAHFLTPGGGSGTKFAVPISAEVNLSGSFFEKPDHPSEIILRVAMQLNDFLASEWSPLKLPFQIYASYVY